jgi:hypothetical protein
MRLSKDDQTLLDLVLAECSTCSLCEGCPDETTRSNALNRIRRAPLRRARLLNTIKEDLEASGLWTVGAIDWKAIGEFIREYGPDILKFILSIISLF